MGRNLEIFERLIAGTLPPDEQTGILFDPRGANFPTIPAAPTRAEVSARLDELKLLISEFPLGTFAAPQIFRSATESSAGFLLEC